MLLLVIGGLLRFHNLSKQSYWVDEAITIINVQSIQQTGISKLASGSHYQCPLYCYPAAYIANIFGDTATSYRILSVIFGTLFILIIFGVTLYLYNVKVALLSAFLTTFWYFQITWSRQARWYTMFECFFWLAVLCFLYLRNTEKKIVPAIGVIIFTIVAIATHQMGYLLPLILIPTLIYDSWKEKKNNITFISVVTLITALIILLSETLIRPGFILHPLNHITDGQFAFFEYALFYLRNYWFLIGFSIVPFLFKKVGNGKFLVFLFLFYAIATVSFDKNVNYGHLFHVTPVLIILSSVGILYILEKIQNKILKIAFISVTAVVFFTVGGGVLAPKDYYYVENDNPSALLSLRYVYISSQPDWSGAYEYIKTNKTSDEIVVSTTPQFNKIFLNEPGYWLSYFPEESVFQENGKDIYVGAIAVHTTRELKDLISTKNGYIVFEGIYGKTLINEELLSYIQGVSKLEYTRTIENHTVLVYKF
jgi:uncharacterized membrane protein